VIWRSATVAGYIALAILVGVVYGGRGLAILLFCYFWAAAWVAFALAWGWTARGAARWHFRRLGGVDKRREANGRISPSPS
jgi:hypothetical protein